MSTSGQISAEVAEDYGIALSQLVANSRPIISSLTAIAKQHQFDHASTFVKVIQDRLRKVPSKQILPNLYLLDSILKNIGGNYIDLFSPGLSALVCECYLKAEDINLQYQIERLVKTWAGIISAENISSILSFVSRFKSGMKEGTAPAGASIASNPTQQPQYGIYGQQFPVGPSTGFPLSNGMINGAASTGNLASVQQLLASVAPYVKHTQNSVQSKQEKKKRKQDHEVQETQVSSPRHDLAELAMDSESLALEYRNAVDSLYDDLKLQCKQCGFRFVDDVEGNERYNAHLDWHFRQNRRITERGNLNLSRDWFLPESAWIESSSVDTTSKETPVFTEPEADGAAADGTVNPKGQDDEVPESIIPMNPDLGRNCNICNEEIERFYDEEEDEWMMRNAIIEDGALYHYSCLREKNAELGQAPPTLGKRKIDDI